MVRHAGMVSFRPHGPLSGGNVWSSVCLAAMLCLVSLGGTAAAAEPASGFVGNWAFTLPNGRAGWLGVTEADGRLAASLLWGNGSPVPIAEVEEAGETLRLSRPFPGKPPGRVQRLSFTRRGDELSFATTLVLPDGSSEQPESGRGIRIPPPPPRPDLEQVEYGEPIRLLAEHDRTGWECVDRQAFDGWSVRDGVLSNRVAAAGRKRGANLRTRAVFEDFRLTTEFRTVQGSNSGIYLRGTYEIQIADGHDRPLDEHSAGALYGRIAPAVDASRPVGTWQTLAVVLLDRHVTVVLNGRTVIDNRPALGCTGGALSSDEFRPGPLMLQGDHSDIDYRNLLIFPIRKPANLEKVSK